jgi:ABC-type sugar transport system ATPase subunit
MGTTDVPVLRATGVTKRFGHVEALRGASLEVRPGEVHALLGDNGAGKSTLVKMLSGVHSPDEGTIEIDGRAVRFGTPRDAQEAGVETVYQDLALASTLPPGDNVFLGRELLKPGLLGKLGFVDRTAMRRRAAEELATVGARVPSAVVPVSALSGGQKQAVAISRSLIWGRRLLIMDEPTAALGARQTHYVLELIKRVRDDRGMAILLISHSLPDVFEVADRVTVLRLGEDVMTAPIGDCTTESLLGAITGATTLGARKEAA